MPQKEEIETWLRSEIFEGNQHVLKLNKDLRSKSLKEKRYALHNEFLDADVVEIQIDGIFLSMRDGTIKKKYEVEIVHSAPVFKLHFELIGDSKYNPNPNAGLPIYIPSGHYNLFYLPKVDGTLSFDAISRKTLEIRFTEAFIKRTIGNKFKETFERLGRSIDENQPFLLWENSKPIGSLLEQKIFEIRKCEYEGITKKAYLEAKVLELLVIVLAQSTAENYEESNSKIPKQEYAAILRVEQHIRENLQKELTIPELAKIAGFNTSKLKKEFKIVFQTTIFKHITDLRMQKAQELIKEHQLSISQAAYEVGYKNPQHFTAAFKRTLGYLPSALRA